MEKKEKIKIIKELKNKKKINWLIIRIIILFSLIISIIFGIFFSVDGFRYSYKKGIDYSGGYQIQIDVFDKKNSNFSYDTPNGDNKKGLELLRNKLDPLLNQNLYLKLLGHSSIEVIIGNNIFKSYDELSKTIQQLGSIYLTDSKGKDLLINDNNGIKERIPLSEIISGSKIGIDQTHRTIITLQIKNHQKWNNIINNLKSLEEKNGYKQQLYIWIDIGKMIDNLRHDINVIQSILTLFNVDIRNKISSKDWTNIYHIFDIEYYDIGNSQINFGNLLDLTLNYPISQIKTWMKEKHFRFTTVSENNLLIDPNDKFDITNKYIDPLRPYLQEIIEYNIILTETYKKHIINWNSIKIENNIIENSNKILTSTETEAHKISNLINSGLSGLEFVISSYRNINPIISKNIFKILILILNIIILIIFIIIIFCYRLFGIITVLNLLFTITTTLYFSTLLKIKISPENISALIILFVLLLEGNLIFFSCYKYERYKNNIKFEQAIKIADKKTINIFVNTLIILLIFGFSLFWTGINNIKSFATILLIGLIIIIIMVFFVTRIIYWFIIKINLKEKYYWLDVSKFSFLNLIFKKNIIKKIFNKKINNYLLNSNIYDKKSNIYLEKNKNNLELSTLEPIKNIKIKQIKYIKLNFCISKLILVIGIILLITSLIFFFTGKINIDNTIKSGINISINEELWRTNELKKEDELNKNIINKLKKHLKKFKNINNNNFNYDVYIVKKQENNIKNKILVVSTNITKGTFEYELLTTIATFYNTNLTDPSLILQQTNPIMEFYIIKTAIISIIICLFFIFIYTLFRLNWAQFISIIISIVFTLISTITVAINMQLLITFKMLIAFLIIFCFIISFGIMSISLLNKNKKIINIYDYKIFFKNMYNYIIKIKILRNAHNIFYKEEIKKLIIKKQYLKLKKIKKQHNEEFNHIKLLTKNIKNKNYKLIKKIKKELNIYNYKQIFLQKNFIIFFKKIKQHCIILGIIFTFLLIILAFFSGPLFSFNIIILIGLIISMFSILFFSIPIWIFLEKRRFLNKIIIRNCLDFKSINVDEQIIIGIND